MMKKIYILFAIILFACAKNKEKNTLSVNFELNKNYQREILNVIKSEYPNDTVNVFGQIGLKTNALICKIGNDSSIESMIILNLKKKSTVRLHNEKNNPLKDRFNYEDIKQIMLSNQTKNMYMSGYSDYFLFRYEQSKLSNSNTFYGWKINWANTDLEQIKTMIEILNRPVLSEPQ